MVLGDDTVVWCYIRDLLLANYSNDYSKEDILLAWQEINDYFFSILEDLKNETL